MVYMYHSFLTHLPADGHLGCFHGLVIVNSAAMNTEVHVSLVGLWSFWPGLWKSRGRGFLYCHRRLGMKWVPHHSQQLFFSSALRPGFDPWVVKTPWRRAWQPTPEFLPGESQTEEPGVQQSTGSQSQTQLRTKHSTASPSTLQFRSAKPATPEASDEEVTHCKYTSGRSPVMPYPQSSEPINYPFQFSQRTTFSKTILSVKSESVTGSVMADSLQPQDYSPPVSSVRGILQARILEWVGILFSRGSSEPSDWTWVSCIAGRFFTIWVTRVAPSWPNELINLSPPGALRIDTSGWTSINIQVTFALGLF